MRCSPAAARPPYLAIVHGEISLLRVFDMRPVRIERGADIGPRWGWVGQVRLPASSKSGYMFERPSGSPRFYRTGDRRRTSARSSEGDVAAYALEEFKRQLQARLQGARSHLVVLRARREKLKNEITNLARAIADGHSSAALLSELGKREQELDKISEDLLAADGRGFDAKLQEIEAFVQKRLQDIRGLLFADVTGEGRTLQTLHCNHAYS
jgi:hypothetical protein